MSTFTILTYSPQHKWTLERKSWIEATPPKQNSYYFHIGLKVVSENETQVKSSHLLLSILSNVRQVA